LTHYGPNYGFSPRGGGEEAVKWVKEVNDRRFLDAVMSLSLREAMDLALKEQSACSAGAAAAAAEYARLEGATEGKLIRYTTSWDMYPASSFVGYAAIVFRSSS
jgi:AmmeMemoRadiSam system protein B